MYIISFILQRKIFSLFIIISLINSFFSSPSFKYPYAFKLSNKNIFVIHQLGISICDETFSRVISNVITFQEIEKIKSDADLSKVTSIFCESYYFICLINDIIYIFNPDGSLAKKSNEVITSLSVEYYSLEYLKYNGNLYFVIGFISSKYLYLYCCSLLQQYSLMSLQRLLDRNRCQLNFLLR